MRKEIARLKLDIEEEELQAMLADARRLRARQEQGGWALQEEEEENVRKRQAELKGEQQRDSEDVNKMRGLRIRKARLRSVNRTRLKVWRCSLVTFPWAPGHDLQPMLFAWTTREACGRQGSCLP